MYRALEKRWADFHKDFARRNPSAGLSGEAYRARSKQFSVEWCKIVETAISADLAAMQRLRDAGIKPIFYTPSGYETLPPLLGSGVYVALAASFIESEPKPKRPGLFEGWHWDAPAYA